MRTDRSQQTNGGHDHKHLHCAECSPVERAGLRWPSHVMGLASFTGVSFAMCVDQLPSARAGPPHRVDAAHVPSLLSPVRRAEEPAAPCRCSRRRWAMYSLAIQTELPSTAAAP